MITSLELAARSGASFRQIDYWARCEYLHVASAGGSRPGSGYHRRWAEEEVPVARLLVTLGATDMFGSAGKGRNSSYLPDLLDYVRRFGLTGDFDISEFVTLHLDSIDAEVLV